MQSVQIRIPDFEFQQFDDELVVQFVGQLILFVDIGEFDQQFVIKLFI
jgi:hypothetical protein